MAKQFDRSALRRRIQQLEGLADDERAQLLELLETKKYGLVWEDKPEEVEEQLRRNLPVLDEVKERRIVNNPDSPNHVIIEGDNLEALNVLSYTHEGRIDVIYIDPPYNTGNRDFVYNDRFVDTDDDYRHSKWLSFMSKRLRLAKRLLSDKGVIFISIDDNEQANLKLLCDEVFGERNFVTNFVWQSTPGSNTGTEIKTVTEYILLYAKIKDFFEPNTKQISDSQKYVIEDDYVGKRGKYVLNKLDRRMTGSHYSDALNYQIETPDHSFIYPGSTQEKQEHWNWRWSANKVKWGIENGFIVFKQTKGIWSIYFKQYQFVNNNDEVISRALPFQNLLNDDDSFNSARGSADLMSVLSAKSFDYPKPTSLVKRVLEISTKPSSTVLDFFAGSGTTLHAVMQLNKEDGGSRKCILVTNNENGICENVTYERNRRVISGYTTPKGVQVEGLRDNNLRYFRTRLLPRRRTNRNIRDLMAAATDLLCLKEDIWNEPEIADTNRQFTSRDARLFADGDRRMLIIYNEEAIARIVEWLETYTADEDIRTPKMKVYTFSSSGYAYDDDFDLVADRVQLCALPAAIYEAYRHVLPKEDRYYDLELIDNPTTEGKEDWQ